MINWLRACLPWTVFIINKNVITLVAVLHPDVTMRHFVCISSIDVNTLFSWTHNVSHVNCQYLYCRCNCSWMDHCSRVVIFLLQCEHSALIYSWSSYVSCTISFAYFREILRFLIASHGQFNRQCPWLSLEFVAWHCRLLQVERLLDEVHYGMDLSAASHRQESKS